MAAEDLKWSFDQGGAQPVSLGDKLKNDEYQIKCYHSDIDDWNIADDELAFHYHEHRVFLAYLAKSKVGQYAVIQIWDQQASLDHNLNTELDILDRLLNGDDRGRTFIHAPIDKFWHESSNGRLLCLVYNLYGPNLSYLDWPVQWVWKMAKDILQGLDYIHEKGLCHGRLDRSSFVMTYPDLDPYDEAKVLSLFNQTIQGTPRDKAVSELNDTGTDRYGQPIKSKFRFKLQKFGSSIVPSKTPAAFFETDVKDGRTPSTKLLRECPPLELALDKSYTRTSDIWYAAIQIGSIAKGYPSDTCAFMSPDIRGFTSDYDALLHARIYLGELPPTYRSASFAKTSTRGKAEDKASLPAFTSFGPDELKRYLRDNSMVVEEPAVILLDEDYDALVKLLQEMLAWEPRERVTAKKALESPFIRKE